MSRNQAPASTSIVPYAMHTCSTLTSIGLIAFWWRNVCNLCSLHQMHIRIGCESAIKGLSATHHPTSMSFTTGHVTPRGLHTTIALLAVVCANC